MWQIWSLCTGIPVNSSEPGKRQQGGYSLVDLPPAPTAIPELVETGNVDRIASATDDATIFVNCQINGYYGKAPVDTGAAVTIIHEDLLMRVQSKETQVERTTKTIVGANNTPLNISGIAEVDVSMLGIQRVMMC